MRPSGLFNLHKNFFCKTFIGFFVTTLSKKALVQSCQITLQFLDSSLQRSKFTRMSKTNPCASFYNIYVSTSITFYPISY